MRRQNSLSTASHSKHTDAPCATKGRDATAATKTRENMVRVIEFLGQKTSVVGKREDVEDEKSRKTRGVSEEEAKAKGKDN